MRILDCGHIFFSPFPWVLERRWRGWTLGDHLRHVWVPFTWFPQSHEWAWMVEAITPWRSEQELPWPGKLSKLGWVPIWNHAFTSLLDQPGRTCFALAAGNGNMLASQARSSFFFFFFFSSSLNLTSWLLWLGLGENQFPVTACFHLLWAPRTALIFFFNWN